MIVIMKIPKYAGDRNDQDALAMECFKRFNDAYDDNAADSEVYLRQPDGEAGAALDMEFTDGRQDPDKIRQLAEDWNQRIESNFDAALGQLMAQRGPWPGR